MKKTLKRLIACVAVVMMVFALCTTAFADGGYYYGRMVSGFNCGQTFNKINDRTIEDQNVSSRTGGYDSTTSANYISILRLDGATKKSATVVSGGNNKYTTPTDKVGQASEKGKFSLRVENQGTAPIYIRGKMFIYTYASDRVITDTTHYWG